MSNLIFLGGKFIYDLYLPGELTFHFVHHLPRLVAMFAKKNYVYKKSEQFYFIFINNQGKQHKIQIKENFH